MEVVINMNDIKSITNNYKRRYIIDNIISEIITLIFVIICNINMFLLILWIISVLFTTIKVRKTIKNTNDIYNNLTNQKIKEINKELKTPLLFVPETNWIMTDNYIIIKNNKFDIIGYNDIILMYYKLGIKGRHHKMIVQSIIIILKNKNKYKFTVDADNDEDFIKCSNVIREKNKNVLEEKNKQNINLIKEKYNIDIRKI